MSNEQKRHCIIVNNTLICDGNQPESYLATKKSLLLFSAVFVFIFLVIRKIFFDIFSCHVLTTGSHVFSLPKLKVT